MKTLTDYLWFETKEQRELVRITDAVTKIVKKSGIEEGMALVSAMHITAGVFVNDELAPICTALARQGFVAVLTGGSAATYYAPQAYQSRDIDFVLTFKGRDGEKTLEALGYGRRGDFYVHSVSPFPLEFPPGPLAIGEDVITAWSTIHRGDQVLHVLTPADSCRDRLASYLFWNDLSGLEQALAVHVARPDEVDIDALRQWCRREGHAKKFELYEARWRSFSRPQPR